MRRYQAEVVVKELYTKTPKTKIVELTTDADNETEARREFIHIAYMSDLYVSHFERIESKELSK